MKDTFTYQRHSSASGEKKEGSQNQKSTKERRKWETKLIVTKTTGQTLCQVERTGRSESPRKSFW